MSRTRRKLSFHEDSELPELPNGWSWALLNDLATKITDGTHHTPTYTDSGVAFISVKDVRDGKISFDKCRYISQEEHDQLIQRCHPEPGDVLVTKSGTIGRIAIVKTDRPFSLFVSVALIKCDKPEANPKWIALAFENWMRTVNIANDIKGTAIKNLHLEDFRLLKIPFAPLPEQKRIVSKIEELFSDLDAGVSALERARANLRRYRASVLKSAVEGRLTKKWRSKNPDVEPASELLAPHQRLRSKRLGPALGVNNNSPPTNRKVQETGPKNWQSKYIKTPAVQSPSYSDQPAKPTPQYGWCWATLGATCR